jgi:integrase
MLPPPETDQLTTPRTPKLRGRFWKGTTRYRRKDSEGNIIGKILEPITPEEFAANMEGGKFVKPEHRAFVTLIYYSGVREQEANRVTPENFTVTRTAIFFDVGKRLKHSETTPALKLPLKAPYMGLLKDRIQETPKGQKLFPFSSKTCYNIMYRAGFHYPHLCRLSRITNLFEQGWTVTQVRSWTGLSLSALNYYLGTVDTAKMGDKLS